MAKMRSVSVPDTKVELWDRGVTIAGRRGISMSAFVLRCIEDNLLESERLANQPDEELCDVCGGNPRYGECYKHRRRGTYVGS